jgi:rRNA maturation protein Nop10
MKDKNVHLTQTPKYSPETQCMGKMRYTLKRRAIDIAHAYAANTPDAVLTVYPCPHCGFYHIGNVRKK